jgi:hypothetical protein
MSTQARLALAISAVLLVSTPAPVDAGPTLSVTFDEAQLVDNDPLLQFYNGGKTYRGIGPGPSLGITFGLNARERKNNSLIGTYTPPGFMQLYSDQAREGEGISTHMDVSGGFSTTVFFDYAAIDAAGRLRIFSGLDGTGSVLADVNLPVTSPLAGPGTFVADSVSFSGIGHSIIFDGGNKQLAFDDFTLTSAVPEPSSWILFVIAGAMFPLVVRTERVTRPRPPLQPS